MIRLPLLWREIFRLVICRMGDLHAWHTISTPNNDDGNALFVRQCLRCAEIEVYMSGWIRASKL